MKMVNKYYQKKHRKASKKVCEGYQNHFEEEKEKRQKKESKQI